MKKIILIMITIFCVNGLTKEDKTAPSASIEIEFKTSTRAKQHLAIEKVKGRLFCVSKDQPPHPLDIKGLELSAPFGDQKYLKDCENIISWTFAGKTTKSCYTPHLDQKIDKILFECFN